MKLCAFKSTSCHMNLVHQSCLILEIIDTIIATKTYSFLVLVKIIAKAGENQENKIANFEMTYLNF